MKRRTIFIIAVIICLLAYLPQLAPEEPVPDRAEGTLMVEFLDVEQGDSALIHLPNGETMLIDAGERDQGEHVVATLQEQGITRLDYVIGTHPHTDHIGGLQEVIESFDIGEIYMPKKLHTTKTFENLLLAIRDKGLSVTSAKAGVTVLEDEGVFATFVAPQDTDYEELNDYSAVLRLTFGETSFLFTGDAEAVSEHEMLNSGQSLSADVLKVGHHGSTTSNTVAFLKAVSPTHAVISCGAGNDYGHPHKQILKRLSALKATVWRTDEQGKITVTSDGTTLTVTPEK
ncbi:MAG: MBL fold metallo-hydrolase [Clostridia bacterium]|nr:MBL fold metallo-hydrolase [Clostridia bacterium]